jgi:type II secretory pathway pseudopilin PulG
MSRKRDCGLTLVELMVTLGIALLVLGLALTTMRQYIPRQRLISSQGAVENLLNQAQSEATARTTWTCITFDMTSRPVTLQLRADTGKAHGNEGACGASNSTLIATTQLKPDVVIPGDSVNCSMNVLYNCILWFGPSGSPKICPNSGWCGVTRPEPGSPCIDSDIQIVLSNRDLDGQARAREVEVLAGGLIRSVKPSDKGLDPSFYARGVGATDVGGCE